MPKPTKKIINKKKKGGGHHAKGSTKNRSIDELCADADQAFLQDPNTAVQLYTVALHRLGAKQQSNGDSAVPLATDKSEYSLRRAEILEKRAEILVSLQEREKARDDYRSALHELLGNSGQSDEDQLTPPPPAVSTDRDFIARVAGLYLYVGQLSEGEDALKAYQYGIQCLEQTLQDSPPDSRDQISSAPFMDTPDYLMEEDEKMPTTQSEAATDGPLLLETRKQLAASYCSVGELYLTDLCFAPDAESNCERFVQLALSVYPGSSHDSTVSEPPTAQLIDALQTAASLRLSQSGAQKRLEAVSFMHQVYAQMRVGCEALSELVGIKEDSQQHPTAARELSNLPAVQELPSYEFRCQTAKQLLECCGLLRDEATPATLSAGESDDQLKCNPKTGPEARTGETSVTAAECSQAAVHVLGSLLAENDEVVEIWCLLGDAFALLDPPAPSLSRHYWSRAVEMLNVVHEGIVRDLRETTDQSESDAMEAEAEEISAQIEDLQFKISELPRDADDDDERMEEDS
jgi:tetratricopeptide (TPR) repeat protein